MDFVRKNPPSHGQVVDFEILIRETPHVYGQTEHFESTVLSNKDHSSEQDSLAPQKTKHPCRLTEVSEAEQPHRPLISIPLTHVHHWDSVPNPDAPRGLCVLHVFALANTRTRPVV